MNSSNSLNHDEMIPLKFHLSQNYPNPFSGKTTIKYCVPFKTKVQITVTDSKGKLIEKLVDEDKPAGTYKIEFQSSTASHHLTSGEYYYSLEAEEFITEKKMVLIT
jgi:hypothetical protein